MKKNEGKRLIEGKVKKMWENLWKADNSVDKLDILNQNFCGKIKKETLEFYIYL